MGQGDALAEELFLGEGAGADAVVGEDGGLEAREEGAERVELRGRGRGRDDGGAAAAVVRAAEGARGEHGREEAVEREALARSPRAQGAERVAQRCARVERFAVQRALAHRLARGPRLHGRLWGGRCPYAHALCIGRKGCCPCNHRVLQAQERIDTRTCVCKACECK